MDNILANKIVGITALREPNKVIQEAGNQPVAIMNRNEVAGYFVPASAVNKIDLSFASDEELKATLEHRKDQTRAGVEYLQDK